MTILYALVSCQRSTVLAEYTAASVTGNFATITRMLLEKIPMSDSHMTYLYDDYVFHYIVESGICYLCMSDDKSKHRIPYTFLQDMKQNFLSKYSVEHVHRSIAFSLNEEFSHVIELLMQRYNSGGPIDSIDALKLQIDSVKDGMIQNIENVLERGEKIELLVDKTDRLNQQAFRFERSSRNLHRHFYWRAMKYKICLSVIGILLFFFLLSSICGGLSFHRCRKR